MLLTGDAALAANDSFVAVTDKLAENIGRLFENGVETDIILYLGLCNGAGWVDIAGRQRRGFARNRKNYRVELAGMNPPCRL